MIGFAGEGYMAADGNTAIIMVNVFDRIWKIDYWKRPPVLQNCSQAPPVRGLEYIASADLGF